ncbi:MAG: tRNA adenosine(34) deaminase TadA [candidate division Zixibacteria bacterium]|nr:tRNA adenosine(34) deaminase TadA [candidate division Zixibacteria bacterium]
MIGDNDKYFMELALAEAERAAVEGEVPVGCVIVHDGMVIGKGHNRTESLCDPTAHAEILAITAAANHLESWRLEGCSVYSSLEPCPMCAGALVLARVDRLVYGAKDSKFGACMSLYNIVQDIRLNHQLEVIPGILEERSAQLLKSFFKTARNR